MRLVRNILFVWSTIFSLYADLYVPGAVLSPFSDYILGSSTEPDGGGDGAGVFLNIVPVDAVQSILTVNTMYYGTVGINHIWYEVDKDTIFNATYVAATTPFFDMSDYSSVGQINMIHNQSFFIGFYLEGGDNGVYGWAELIYDGSSLHLLDSAAENDGVGIIAGQYQQVPEPATILLFSLGGFGTWLLRRNKGIENI